MARKDIIAERLGKMEVVEGVVPTRVNPSSALDETAQFVRKNDIAAAMRSANEQFKTEKLDFALEPAIGLLSGSPALRDQVAGFAKAGINLFHATPDLLNSSLAKRESSGANGMVSRVLLSQQRILLETARVIVRFNEGMKPDDRRQVLKQHHVTEFSSDGLPPDTVKCSVDKGNAVDVSLALMQDSTVEYAEPDFIEHIGARHTPPDPEFAQQWHHTNIAASNAWDVSKGEDVSVAIIDNGFDIQHPDLNFGALSGWFEQTPDLADADFVLGTVRMKANDHGTACAGMLAARSGNGSGGCGVAFAATPNMIACASDQIGTQSTLARALAYAAKPDLENAATTASGADIIACSLGPNGAVWELRQVLSDAIDFAATHGRGGRGCAIFWACTNGNFPIGSDGVCSHPHVIAVGRSRRDDQHDGSGFGPQLEFLAPGVEVRIPAMGGGYQTTTGTSFAAPCAAGVAALALAQHLDLTAVQLRQLMRDTCDKKGNLPYIDGRNTRFGHGRVNASRAVAEAKRLAAMV